MVNTKQVIGFNLRVYAFPTLNKKRSTDICSVVSKFDSYLPDKHTVKCFFFHYNYILNCYYVLSMTLNCFLLLTTGNIAIINK